MNKQIHLQDQERILMTTRKHWFILLRDVIGVLFVGGVSLIFIVEFIPTNAMSSYIISIWLLALWLSLFTIWTNYYLDTWIITDRRIINIDQITLFNREVSTLRIERIQDVTTEVQGVIATLLHFGNIRVQTAGATAEFSLIKGIPNPAYVKSIILEQVDIIADSERPL